MNSVKEKRIIQEYCCGCGLCKSIYGINFKVSDGFYQPVIDDKYSEQLRKICPSITAPKRNKEGLYGVYLESYLGYSLNPDIRKKGSSGGILTSLAIMLLEQGKVDGVLHIGADDKIPWKTKLYCSRNKNEIINNAGSRYAQSLSLDTIYDYLNSNNRYLLIAKPCDIRAMRNYAMIDERVDRKIPYMFSFFCMGTPSITANEKLITELGCSIDECISLKYRGDGWPGYAIAVDKDENEHRMTYNQSWGKILGRDLRKYCRFCMDGMGEASDVSCGDAWFLDEDNKPIFEEREGRNVIFARTSKGKNILKEAYNLEYINISDFDDVSSLKYMQKSQINRKSYMLFRQLGMRIAHRVCPTYRLSFLTSLAKNGTISGGFNELIGTLSRIKKKKL